MGFYEDPPSRRWGWDSDGTIAFTVSTSGGTIFEADTQQKQLANSEDGDSDGFQGTPHWTHPFGQIWVGFIFPEKRTMTHYYANIQNVGGGDFNGAGPVQVSDNTTNGYDGDWSTIASGYEANHLVENVTPVFRTALQSLGFEGYTAVRWRYTTDVRGYTAINALHMYGYKFAGETPHRIDFAASDNSELIVDEDYGDQPRGSTRTWSTVDTWNEGTGLFLYNRSPEKVAQNVAITVEDLSGNMASSILLSKDDITYNTSLLYTEIQPLTRVGPIFVQHDIDIEESLGVRTSRLRCVVETWV